ncbi:hypothetical protein [Chryseobacterium nepalense]|nr:hypothetical protein [Chryseobacterium nepalense]
MQQPFPVPGKVIAGVRGTFPVTGKLPAGCGSLSGVTESSLQGAAAFR